VTPRENRVIRIAFKTTGCKVSQADAEAARRALSDLPVAFVGPGEAADLVVVNACAVTRGAERDGRVFVHRGARSGASVILAGCLATRVARHGDDGRLPEGVRVVPGAGDDGTLVATLRAEVLRRAEARAPEDEDGRDAGHEAGCEAEPRAVRARARPLVKVQDGCDCRCSFCIVPDLRGPSRSVPVDRILADVRAAATEGSAEVVLAGVDLAAWGRDLRDGSDLASLLARLGGQGTGMRFRLSSVEPPGLTDRLLDAMAAGPDVAPHLHVPLQSGSDRILRTMRRPYTAREFAGRVNAFARTLPGLAIGLDVIVGFPGETDADFEETRALVESLPVTYLHVFPFSARPGTDAANLPGAPPHAVKTARSRVLRDLSETRLAAHAARLAGTTVEVVDIRGRPGAVVESLAGDHTRVFRRDPEGPRSGRSRLRVASARGADAWAGLPVGQKSGPQSQAAEFP